MTSAARVIGSAGAVWLAVLSLAALALVWWVLAGDALTTRLEKLIKAVGCLRRPVVHPKSSVEQEVDHS